MRKKSATAAASNRVLLMRPPARSSSYTTLVLLMLIEVMSSLSSSSCIPTSDAFQFQYQLNQPSFRFSSSPGVSMQASPIQNGSKKGSNIKIINGSSSSSIRKKRKIVAGSNDHDSNSASSLSVPTMPMMPSMPTSRRSLFHSCAATAAVIAITTTPTQEANAAFSFFNSKYSLSVVTNTNSTAAASMRQPLPFKESSAFQSELATEACLLKLLPVKKPVFRKLEQQLLTISSMRSVTFGSVLMSVTSDPEMEVEKMYEYISAKVNETLIMLDSKRNYLEPVFIMNDTTDMAITKALKGEGLIEKLRTEIVSIRVAAQRQDADGVYEAKKKALRALSELGELLVEKFPYDVPKEGKFSYLPRLLGRAKVTFTIVRPGNTRADKDVLLGNVTVLADGYAAPVTAGNFVDLAARNFYNGLPVKDLSKRLGVTASLTMAEDSLVAYDIASTVDKIAGEDGVIKKSLDRFLKKVDEGLGIELEDISKADNTNASSNSNTDNNTVLTSMPVAGSFNEGFYDPLTAQPRRIPLEIVQFDRLLGTAKLSYESGFSTNAATTNSGLGSLLESNARSPPLLTFDIPGLVAMNHPDLNLNGGSSEFFCLTKKDLVPERTTLLNGKYAPFGYVIEGLDLMMDLQAGDIISATSVDESGMMNLMKIRGTSFADAMNSDENN